MTDKVAEHLQKLRQNVDPSKSMPVGSWKSGKLPKVAKAKPAKLIKWR